MFASNVLKLVEFCGFLLRYGALFRQFYGVGLPLHTLITSSLYFLFAVLSKGACILLYNYWEKCSLQIGCLDRVPVICQSYNSIPCSGMLQHYILNVYISMMWGAINVHVHVYISNVLGAMKVLHF